MVRFLTGPLLLLVLFGLSLCSTRDIPSVDLVSHPENEWQHQDTPSEKILLQTTTQLLSGLVSTLGLSAGPTLGPTVASTNGSFYRWDSVATPISRDWRKTDAITLVKDQGKCASCWAIAAADTVSMMWSIYHGNGSRLFNSNKTETGQNNTVDPQFDSWGEQDVSPQEICECGLGSCCEGGWPEWAFKYILDNGGISSWKTYPYTTQEGTCSSNSSTVVQKAEITGWELVPPNSPEAARKAVTVLPYLTFISASSASFQSYKGTNPDGSISVYDGDCGTELNHVVVVVGFNTTNVTTSSGTLSQGYWIIKNSWGSNWGDDGYMYLANRTGSGKCGIHLGPGYFPMFYKNSCNRFLNHCGGGSCSFNVLSSTPVCTCPSGFVLNSQSNPPKCVRSNPCGSNPNPCGAGNCTNLADGSYSCSCSSGFIVGSSVVGSPTCVPFSLAAGLATVQTISGNTLKAVATAYGTTTSILQSLNSWVTSATAAIPPGAAISLANTTGSFCTRAYTVQVGDTCSSLASRFRLTVSLQTLNPLISCGSLLQNLLLPGTEVCLARLGSWTPSPSTETCNRTYEVQPGDTCTTIQNQFNITSDSLLRFNPGLRCDQAPTSGSVLCVGQTNTTRCGKFYRVQHGDSCASVWLANNLTQAQFFALNPGVRCTFPYFNIGLRVCVDWSVLGPSQPFSFPYVVQTGDTLNSIYEMYEGRCGTLASPNSTCAFNSLVSCRLPPSGSTIRILCKQPVGRTCGCDDNSDAVFGADGVWYQNFCSAACNYALPAISRQEFCRRACLNRAGLQPYNDPDGRCSRPCPWPQWSPQPRGWDTFSDTFCQYYKGACQDWCVSSANTAAKVRKDEDNWSKYYSDCYSQCRRNKC